MSRIRTQLTDEDKRKILAYIETMNAEQVARKIERDPTTIRRFIAKYKSTEKIDNLPRSGWPKALNNNEKNELLQEVINERCKPLYDIVSDLGLNCCLTTAAKILHDSGIKSYVAAKKPFVSKDHAEAHVI